MNLNYQQERERERTEIIENLYRLYHKFLQDSKACHTEALAEVSLNDRDFSFATQTQNDKYQGKIVWNRISNDLCFCYDEAGHFILDSMFMITGSNEMQMKYLIGVLNASIATHWIKQNAATLGDGVYGAKIYIEKLPIPQIDSKNQKIADEIIALVDKILESKAKDSTTDTSELESKIDNLVYKLYNLTEEEIKIIENKNSEINELKI